MADPVTIALAAAGLALGAAPALFKPPKDTTEKDAKRRAQKRLAAERERVNRARSILTTEPGEQVLTGEQTGSRTILGV